MGLDIYFNVVNREAYNTVKTLKNKHLHYDRNEIGYFRKFWGLLNMLDYGEEQYARNVEITESKVDELLEFTKIILCDCFNYIAKDTRLLNDPTTPLRLSIKDHVTLSDFRSQIDSEFIDYLDKDIFNNCTKICEEHFSSSDDDIFEKTFELYNMLISVKEEVNFDDEFLFMNADW